MDTRDTVIDPPETDQPPVPIAQPQGDGDPGNPMEHVQVAEDQTE